MSPHDSIRVSRVVPLAANPRRATACSVVNVMGRATEHLSRLWDEVTDDFLRGEPTNVRPRFDTYFRSYRRLEDVQLDGFCEPFLGPVDRVPKMAFLSLNPGEVQPA